MGNALVDTVCVQQKEFAGCGKGDNVSGCISCHIGGIGNLRIRFDNFGATGQGKHGQFITCTYIEISVGALCDTAHGVRRKTVIFIEGIYDLVIDTDGQSIVIGTDPETSFDIYKQTVYVFYFIKCIHVAEFTATVAVQPGICADPDNTIVCGGDIVCLAAEQTVVAAVDCTDILCIVGSLICGVRCCRGGLV